MPSEYFLPSPMNPDPDSSSTWKNPELEAAFDLQNINQVPRSWEILNGSQIISNMKNGGNNSIKRFNKFESSLKDRSDEPLRPHPLPAGGSWKIPKQLDQVVETDPNEWKSFMAKDPDKRKKKKMERMPIIPYVGMDRIRRILFRIGPALEEW